MAKTKTKAVAPVPEKKAGDGGRIAKPAAKVEKDKATAKAVVAAQKADEAKKALKESLVWISLT
jgi:hypothetical protein